MVAGSIWQSRRKGRGGYAVRGEAKGESLEGVSGGCCWCQHEGVGACMERRNGPGDEQEREGFLN
jgi:hypothetical protein